MVSGFIKTTFPRINIVPFAIHFIRQQSTIHKSQEFDNMSFLITRVCMAAGVAAVNGHTDQVHKTKSVVNSFRHGKKAFAASAGVDSSDLRPVSGFLNEGVVGSGNRKTTDTDESLRQVMYFNCWGPS
ncbi:unnamed protein product [Lactuca virosa]|uniref:Uncharacterized protein n=1 Tax=Lactuca virosa TaxID=75947 RepID=A0AAU9LJK0_9ASTR|nr:unnamed protein product [Lactuca virosa]